MSKYYFACAFPSIELPVVVVDPTGKTAQILVGYKRYDLEEATARFEALQEANAPLTELSKLREEGVVIEESAYKVASEQVKGNINNMLKEEITHFRNVQLFEQDEKKPGEFKKSLLIADSRTAAENPEFGGSCLNFLLGMGISHSIWRTALINGMVTAISNQKLGKDSELKNL